MQPIVITGLVWRDPVTHLSLGGVKGADDRDMPGHDG
jgi:hypothetical protein